MQKKRKINEIIVHCTATEYGVPVSKKDLYRWHVESRGFSDIGYHYVVKANGDILICRPVSEVGAHCHGHNKNTIGVCYVGGLLNGMPADTRTSLQKDNLIQLIDGLCRTYPITKITGHNEYSNKACPCFDVNTEYKHLIKTLL